MPLVKSSSEKAFKQNVSTLTGEIGKSPHVKNQKQALAIAYSVKRRNRAAGGSLKPASWQVRNEARGMMHSGPINSMVPGRTDHHGMRVAPGSYVVNADTVSHLGQNNSLAGHAVLSKVFGMSPYGGGQNMPLHGGAGAPRPPRMAGLRSQGGAKGSGHSGEPVEVNTAGGEFVIPPERVLWWMEKHGFKPDLDHGHKILDHWMQAERKDHIRTLKKLPGPAKS